MLSVVAIAAIRECCDIDRRPMLALLSWLMLGTLFTLYALAIVRIFVRIGGQWVAAVIGFCDDACANRLCSSTRMPVAIVELARRKRCRRRSAEESHQ